MMRLDICTRYDRFGASSRCRYYLYEDALREAGFDVRIHPFFRGGYLKRLYADGVKSRLHAGMALLRRLAELPGYGNALYVEYELLPQLPWDFEARFLKNRRFVLNFDDNVWEKYRNRPHLEKKYDQLVRRAAGVIVANDFLAEQLLPLQPNLVKIPTVVDLNSYPEQLEKFPRFTIGWIGTPVTYRYLELHAPVLRKMAENTEFELLVIARRDLASRALPGVPMRFIDWSPETEARDLCRCHIGIMPLTDDPFSRGKSAYKLIQYQAAGLPAIASPVGENRNVIRNGENGFLATTPHEWCRALEQLKNDSALRQRMSGAARTGAGAYSLQRYAPVLIDFLKRALFS